jgi:hypothetical protein
MPFIIAGAITDLRAKGVSISLLGDEEETEIKLFLRVMEYGEFIGRFYSAIPVRGISVRGMCLAAAAKKSQEEFYVMEPQQLMVLLDDQDSAAVLKRFHYAELPLSDTGVLVAARAGKSASALMHEGATDQAALESLGLDLQDVEIVRQTAPASICATVLKQVGDADGPLFVGTRVSVDGYGSGTYEAFDRSRIGANTHTIAFDGGGSQKVKLKGASWSVLAAPAIIPADPAPVEAYVKLTFRDKDSAGDPTWNPTGFAEHLQISLGSSCDAGDAKCIGLCALLPGVKEDLMSLEFHYCGLTDEFGRALVAVLPQLYMLEFIDVALNPMSAEMKSAIRVAVPRGVGVRDSGETPGR